ncbi:uncharacterized protein LAESUDRAFT_744447 [Laetiporus sulphureus 93-53]|uniref:Pinin/SDK/MemA protein domain-containing protein n=1 Tax=Laetiporus sulphureus 93-53 TaxID=1314785 RepID=A0A165D218_9APHY|nr:uncharacterized protein LAESUDRAFT_744447 [Laetiporus sulphureus 93-53]KZT03998.1 hypothetical protein LAESUDRAFT_744447 [Laetiporus sulphureus 93-53]
MATESPQPAVAPDADTPMMEVTQPQAPPPEEKARKRPRIEMGSEQRRRGKSMFALAVGTLTKAKNEDRQRNQSEAAKKRQMIEHRLQEKLRRETDSVRRAEEAKKDKTAANRREEELQLKDSIQKLRRTRLPLLANFLLTSDTILELEVPSSPPTDAPVSMDTDYIGAQPASSIRAALAGPPRTHPPPLYYLPAVLLPSQEAFLKKRKEEANIATEAEWASFASERTAGIAEITRLRQRVAEEEARSRAAAKPQDEDIEVTDATASAPEQNSEKVKEDKEVAIPEEKQNGTTKEKDEEGKMDVDDGGGQQAPPEEGKREQEAKAKEEGAGQAQMQADDEDAVEY